MVSQNNSSLLTNTIMSKLPYSPQLVKIPAGLEFLADYTETSYVQSGHLVSGVYPTIKGIKQTRPFFLMQMNVNGTPLSQNVTMNEFATAFLSEKAPTSISTPSEGVVQADESRYTMAADGTMTKVVAIKPEKYFCQVNAFGGLTVGKKVSEAAAILGPDFEIHILSYTKPETITKENPKGEDSGQVYMKDADPNGIINGQTAYWGYVTAARVFADCKAMNMYSTSRRNRGAFMAGQYPFIRNINDTIEVLPPSITIHYYTKRPKTNSVIPFLRYENGKVINNTFVNKLPYDGGVISNPAGNDFTPTFVLMLTNGGPDQTSGVYSIRSRAQSVVHLRSFDEFSVVSLNDGRDGYIDEVGKTIYINPSKPAIVRLEVTQARIGDIMAKTWAVEGAINLQTGVWSKFFETL